MSGPRVERVVRAFAIVAAVIGVVGALPAQSAGAQSGWRWPVAGELLTAYSYGSDPYAPGQHRGIDVAAGCGQLRAAAA